MKKVYKLFSLLVLLAMVFLALSCSEKAEMPYNANNEGIKPLTTGDFEEGQIVYIKFYIDGESLSDNIDDYVPLNPGLGHFIEFIIEGIEGGYVTFKSEQSKKVYLNNLNASLKMINNEAYTGAIKHIENFLLRFIDVIEEPARSIVNVFLNLTINMLENPDISYAYAEMPLAIFKLVGIECFCVCMTYEPYEGYCESWYCKCVGL